MKYLPITLIATLSASLVVALFFTPTLGALLGRAAVVPRARPVVLTAVTAILGVLPIAFGVNIEFLSREITVGAPATQWWINLSTAIVFGLGFATVLTLVVTPAALMAIANLVEWRAGRKAGRVQRRAARLAAAQPAE